MYRYGEGPWRDRRENTVNGELRYLADCYMQIQKTRIAMGNRKSAVERDVDEGPPPEAIIIAQGHMEQAEKVVAKEMLREVKDHPAWPWLEEVKGVSGVLGCKLLGLLDIHKARNVSSFWKFCGLAVTNGERDRPVKGETLSYSIRAKTVCYLIASSFLKCGSPFRDVYDDARVYYEANRPDWSKGRQHNAAMRKMEKVFLQCLWVYWREAEGLPVTKPYAHDKLGHEQLYKPEDFIE